MGLTVSSGGKPSVAQSAGGRPISSKPSPFKAGVTRCNAEATQYFRLILKIIGITDVTIVPGGGAKVVDMGGQAMGGFISSVEPEIERAAAA